MSRSRSLLMLVVVAALLVAACQPAEEPGVAPDAAAPEAEATPDVDTPAPGPDEATPDDPADAQLEAPKLADLVAAGELPPLEERLPDNPMVVEPNDRLGEYGGVWRSAILGPADGPWWMYRTIGYEQLTRWDIEFTEVVPNIAESFEANDDATEFTFHLREGMRWSDGEPFTAHDIVFWYEAYAMNEQLSGDPPPWMVTGGVPGTVEAVDDHTVVFAFTGAPNGLLTQRLATHFAADVAAMPRHYLEQFHPDYNPDVDTLVQEEGLADWAELFELKAAPGTQLLFQTVTELPTLRPFVIQNELAEGTRVVWERNPYYWKVDPEGRQLPYLDGVQYDVVEDSEVILLKALNGELDMHSRHITSAANKPVLADNRESGNYRFYDVRGTFMNTMVINLNLTHQDPAMREMIRNQDFRVGLSHAIDRQEIIDVVHVGQGEPHQSAPRPDSEFYNERLAKQYTEYDVELANEHLDRAGYGERDGAGYRLRPDGERVVIAVEVAADQQERIDALELITDHWADVGVELRINAVDRSLFHIRNDTNEFDAAVWGGDSGGGASVVLDPRRYIPVTIVDTNFAPAWVWWYQGDPRGEEPPEATRRQLELYDQLQATAEPEEQAELMHEILEISADEFYAIGISLDLADGYGIVRNDFHNVPERMPGGVDYPNPAPTNPEQYFIEQ